MIIAVLYDYVKRILLCYYYRMKPATKLLIAASILSIFILALVFTPRGDGEDPTSGKNSTRSETKNDARPVFSFSAKPEEMKCNIARIPSDPKKLQLVAQGQFCRIPITVENMSKEVQSLVLDGTYLIGGDNQKYTPDLLATTHLNPLPKDLEPGVKIDSSLVFDIPKSYKPKRIEIRNQVHDDAFAVDIPL